MMAAYFKLQRFQPRHLQPSLEQVSEDLTVRKLLLFSQLEKGWNYGRGIPASSGTISIALQWVHFLTEVGFTSTNAFPGENGEISVTAYHKNIYLECIFDLNGETSFYYERGDENILSMENARLAEVRSEVIKIVGEIWNTLDLSIPSIMMSWPKNLTVQHLGYHRRMAERPSYSWLAFPERGEAYVSTYGNIIQALVENIQFIGHSMTRA